LKWLLNSQGQRILSAQSNADGRPSLLPVDSSATSPVSSGDPRQPCSDLNALLIALDQNLAKQGVLVEPKGTCAACSKAIVGQVSFCFTRAIKSE
jgi:hypothetical protein